MPGLPLVAIVVSVCSLSVKWGMCKLADWLTES